VLEAEQRVKLGKALASLYAADVPLGHASSPGNLSLSDICIKPQLAHALGQLVTKFLQLRLIEQECLHLRPEAQLSCIGNRKGKYRENDANVNKAGEH
jgi:hypothetical protein